MNIIEKLMNADVNKLALPKKEYEVKRLTKLFGFPFVLKLQGLNPERYMNIQENSVEFKKGDLNKIKMYEMNVKTILSGVIEPSLKDTNLQKHFNAVTPKELVNKLFLAGEISDIADEISKLCGYDSQKEIDDEVKN